MNDVLSQSEVESLLAALDSGAGGAAPAPMTPQRRATSQNNISVYDFKCPERVSKEQMRAFQGLHEGFAREMGAGLSGMLRTIVEVKLISVDQLTFSEFVFSLENPTCFNVMEAKGLDGHLILDLNPSIIFPVIDRLLGGGKEVKSAVPARALTDIELKLVSRITDLAISGLESAWEKIATLNLEVSQVESNPQLVQIVPPNEVIVLVSFEIMMGETRGVMNLCIPFNSIESVAGRLSSDTWSAYTAKALDDVQKANLQFGVTRSRVRLSARLGQTQIKTAELVDLEPGDVILLDNEVADGITLRIEGRPVFRGSLGEFKKHKAVQIQTRIDRADDEVARHLQAIRAASEPAHAE